MEQVNQNLDAYFECVTNFARSLRAAGFDIKSMTRHRTKDPVTGKETESLCLTFVQPKND